jgi:hypothetical protein
MKILSFVLVVLLFSSPAFASQIYCSEEDNAYSLETAGIEGETAHQVGLYIQHAVRDKDLEKIISLMADNVMELKVTDNFDEVFTDEWQEAVLAKEPNCRPVGWQGFMLGNGVIWYQFDNETGLAEIFRINDLKQHRNEEECMYSDYIAEEHRSEYCSCIRDSKTLSGIINTELEITGVGECIVKMEENE